ncbi:hypothetical protein PG993_008455 [Apiospora rasikravindrae]|uniref:Uncharacterized protein n=1 Tax=Apiospora rasikravindrae TaxID=990691 RepID=A0ABR1T0D9_9PEZI
MPRFSSRSSSVSAYDDDIDAITPCPLPAPTTTVEPVQPKSSACLSSSSSSYSTSSQSQSHEELPRHSRRSSSSSSSSSHRRVLAALGIHHRHSTRSPSPTTSSSLHEADSEEALDTFASRRRDSVRALERGAGGDPERLWRRMLELQQTYGCYNSARMSAALESGDASLRPSRACLNLLNEHMVLLPEDADYVPRDSSSATATSSKHH